MDKRTILWRISHGLKWENKPPKLKRSIRQRIRIFFNPLSMNTLHVDGKIFESGKKKLRIQKYPDTWERRQKSGVDGVFGCLFWLQILPVFM